MTLSVVSAAGFLECKKLYKKTIFILHVDMFSAKRIPEPPLSSGLLKMVEFYVVKSCKPSTAGEKDHVSGRQSQVKRGRAGTALK